MVMWHLNIFGKTWTKCFNACKSFLLYFVHSNKIVMVQSRKMRGMGRKGSSSYRGSHDTSTPIALPHQPPSHVGCPVGGSSSSSISTPCASRGATPNGGPTTAASGIPTPRVDSLAVSTRLGRMHIKLVNGVLHPSDVCARRITTIFKERLDENIHCWKNVSMETKDFYWNEFQKHFIWDESSSVIRVAWLRKAAKLYRALMCSLRKRKDKTIHATDTMWQNWNEAWNSQEFQTRSLTSTTNRLTVAEGPGFGISRHTGGSISHICHAEKLRARLGHDPLPFELFKVTHTKKGTSDLVDARAEAISDRYLQLEDQASQTQERGEEPPVVDKVALFYEAVGGEKKSRVYGTGSQKSIFYPQSSSSSSTGASSMEALSRITQLENANKELQERVQKVMDERDEYCEQLKRQMEDMMKHFEDRMRSQFTNQDSQPFSDDHAIDHLDDL